MPWCTVHAPNSEQITDRHGYAEAERAVGSREVGSYEVGNGDPKTTVRNVNVMSLRGFNEVKSGKKGPSTKGAKRVGNGLSFINQSGGAIKNWLQKTRKEQQYSAMNERGSENALASVPGEKLESGKKPTTANT